MAVFIALVFLVGTPTALRPQLNSVNTHLVRRSAIETDEAESGHLYGYGDRSDRELSILEKIAAAQYEKDENTQGQLADAERINVFERLREAEITICAEFKRASPSKGPIAVDADITDVARDYADAGAALISVLTEKEYFKGSLEDMQAARRAVADFEHRPAILRKDFIVNEQMIREAKSFGADAVLLIVACLRKSQLFDLVQTCFRYGLEPLVEAHSEVEMKLALESGARCLGINNRNLHTFKLDMDATSRLTRLIPESRRSHYVIASLSGVAARSDVEALMAASPIDSVLVGESLMRANDKRAAVRELLGLQDAVESQRFLAKVCGITSIQDAILACSAGAQFIGLIFAPKSKRVVTQDSAQQIVQAVRAFGEREKRWSPPKTLTDKSQILSRATARGRPLTVAVVQDQPLDEVLDIIKHTGVDLIQLHGNEDQAYADQLPIPYFRVIHVQDDLSLDDEAIPTNCFGYVVDTATPEARGGTGKQFDWSLLNKLPPHIRSLVLVAGGVDADTISKAATAAANDDNSFLHQGILGFDASSRLESEPGLKDAQKVKDYLQAIKVLP